MLGARSPVMGEWISHFVITRVVHLSISASAMGSRGDSLRWSITLDISLSVNNGLPGTRPAGGETAYSQSTSWTVSGVLTV